MSHGHQEQSSLPPEMYETSVSTSASGSWSTTGSRRVANQQQQKYHHGYQQNKKGHRPSSQYSQQQRYHSSGSKGEASRSRSPVTSTSPQSVPSTGSHGTPPVRFRGHSPPLTNGNVAATRSRTSSPYHSQHVPDESHSWTPSPSRYVEAATRIASNTRSVGYRQDYSRAQHPDNRGGGEQHQQSRQHFAEREMHRDRAHSPVSEPNLDTSFDVDASRFSSYVNRFASHDPRTTSPTFDRSTRRSPPPADGGNHSPSVHERIQKINNHSGYEYPDPEPVFHDDTSSQQQLDIQHEQQYQWRQHQHRQPNNNNNRARALAQRFEASGPPAHERPPPSPHHGDHRQQRQSNSAEAPRRHLNHGTGGDVYPQPRGEKMLRHRGADHVNTAPPDHYEPQRRGRDRSKQQPQQQYYEVPHDAPPHDPPTIDDIHYRPSVDNSIETPSIASVTELKHRLWDEEESLQVAVKPSLPQHGDAHTKHWMHFYGPEMAGRQGHRVFNGRPDTPPRRQGQRYDMAARQGQQRMSRSLSPARPQYKRRSEQRRYSPPQQQQQQQQREETFSPSGAESDHETSSNGVVFKSRFYQAAIAARRGGKSFRSRSSGAPDGHKQSLDRRSPRPQSMPEPPAAPSEPQEPMWRPDHPPSRSHPDDHHYAPDGHKQSVDRRSPRPQSMPEPPVAPSEPQEPMWRPDHPPSRSHPDDHHYTPDGHKQPLDRRSPRPQSMPEPAAAPSEPQEPMWRPDHPSRSHPDDHHYDTIERVLSADPTNGTNSDGSEVARLVAQLSSVDRKNPGKALEKIDAILRNESRSSSGGATGGTPPNVPDGNAGPRQHVQHIPPSYHPEPQDRRHVQEESSDEDSDDETSVSSITNPTYSSVKPAGDPEQPVPVPTLSTSNNRRPRPNTLQMYGHHSAHHEVVRGKSSRKRRTPRSPPPGTIKVESRESSRVVTSLPQMPSKAEDDRNTQHAVKSVAQSASTKPTKEKKQKSAAAIALKIRMWDDMSAPSNEPTSLQSPQSPNSSKESEAALSTVNTEDLGSIMTPDVAVGNINRRPHPWDDHIPYSSNKSSEKTESKFQVNPALLEGSSSSNGKQEKKDAKNKYDFDAAWVSLPSNAFFPATPNRRERSSSGPDNQEAVQHQPSISRSPNSRQQIAPPVKQPLDAFVGTEDLLPRSRKSRSRTSDGFGGPFAGTDEVLPPPSPRVSNAVSDAFAGKEELLPAGNGTAQRQTPQNLHAQDDMKAARRNKLLNKIRKNAKASLNQQQPQSQAPTQPVFPAASPTRTNKPLLSAYAMDSVDGKNMASSRGRRNSKSPGRARPRSETGSNRSYLAKKISRLMKVYDE